MKHDSTRSELLQAKKNKRFQERTLHQPQSQQKDHEQEVQAIQAQWSSILLKNTEPKRRTSSSRDRTQFVKKSSSSAKLQKKIEQMPDPELKVKTSFNLFEIKEFTKKVTNIFSKKPATKDRIETRVKTDRKPVKQDLNRTARKLVNRTQLAKLQTKVTQLGDDLEKCLDKEWIGLEKKMQIVRLVENLGRLLGELQF